MRDAAKNLSETLSKSILIIWLCLSLSACIGTVVGLAVDTAIEVAKVPFKIGGAVIDVMTDDEKQAEKSNTADADEGDADTPADNSN